MQAALYELVLQAPNHQVETISEALLELGALSAAVEDADANSESEQPLFGEPNMPEPEAIGWQNSLIKSLFKKEGEALAAVTLLLAQDWTSGVHVLAINQVDDQDWVRLTQSQFSPVSITSDFWIVPSWHTPPAQAKHVIRLDPGMAFGTGTHPTTRMCLHWIATHPELIQNARVLDYGCGSGILAIASALYGAKEVDAVDIDPAAVQASLLNAQANDAPIKIGACEMAQGQYDIVFANILASPLKLLAPLLQNHLKANAHLILAGILERQAQELCQAYAPWVKLEVSNESEGWILMTAHNR